ncbi:helix-turn-helix transcriptional regulator [Thermopolyspora sp. NPDC052614]|uniref:helix-turn-helix domain-containing protein n=1 Tax=Thermopolyspora sp. NPDC052614 TaxID=3155682 RepID=UPI00342BDA7B
MSNPDAISRRIREARRKRGLSQAQLARPELSDSYISLIESGSRIPTPAVLEIIATKLGCSVDYLLHGISSEDTTSFRNRLNTAKELLRTGARQEARERYVELLADPNIAQVPELLREGEYGLALASEACGDLEEAIRILIALREKRYDSLTDDQRIGTALALTRCYRDRGETGMAIEVAEQEISAMLGKGWTDHLIELGATLLSSYYVRGDLLRAEQYAADLLAAAEALGTARAIVAANWNAAWLAEMTGRYQEALPLISRAWQMKSELDDPRHSARLRVAYAAIRLIVQPSEALTCREQLLIAEQELQESSASTLDLADCLRLLAQAEIELGHADAAVKYALRALDVNGDSSSELRADTLTLLGQAYLMLGRVNDADATLKTTVEVLAHEPATRTTAETWLMVAAVLQGIGDPEGSQLAYQRAMECGGV